MNAKFNLVILGFSLMIAMSCMANSAHGIEYHVSTAGSDSSGNGSLLTPWKTPTYGASKLAYGDTLYVHAGTYQITTSGSPIKSAAIFPGADNTTIAAYPGDTVTLIGNGGTMPTNGVIGSFNGATHRIGVTIDGFVIQGIVVMESDNTTVKNCDISVGGDSWSGIAQGEVIWVEACNNCTIQNNKLHNNSMRAQPTNSALIMAYTGSNLLIENNEIYNAAGPGMTLKDTLTNATIRYNYSHDNGLGGIWTANQGSPNGIAIYQNVFVNENTANNAEYGAITFSTTAQNVNVYNNTFYHSNQADYTKSTNSTSVSGSFFNNLSYSPRLNFLSWPYSVSTYVFTYEDYNGYAASSSSWDYRGSLYPSLSSWRTSCQSLLAGCEAHSVTTDPGFLNGSGTYNAPSDFKRASYTANGRGGLYPSVMGAYTTGNETIGFLPLGTATMITPSAFKVNKITNP